MRNKGKNILLPVLIAFLMLASTFVIFTGASEAAQSMETKALGDSGRVLYVYQTDKVLADEWRTFLMDNDYLVDLLPYDGLMDAQYDNYDFVILGNDTTGILTEYLKDMQNSHVPILAIGQGGLYAAIRLGLFSQGYYTGASSGTTNIDAHDLFLYNTPITISGVPGTLSIYNDPAYRVYVFKKSDRNANETLYMGDLNGNGAYSPLLQVNSFVFYGFVQSPKSLTTTGHMLMMNLLYYMDQDNDYNVWIPRLSSRIVLDGAYSYIFEWYPYNTIYVDDTGKNYTALYEDEEYVYVLMHIAITDDIDYMTVTFDTTNSRLSGTTDEHAFYVILSESMGRVRYRESDSSGTWGAFKDPDGVNITANWTFYSDHAMAEVRIFKGYMNLRAYTDNILGFGIQYTNAINYPSTFSFLNASTYITAYSQSHWTGQYEVIRPRAGYAPSVDGIVDYYEWYGSSSYYIQDEDYNPIYLKVLYDGNMVYFGGYVANYSGVHSAFYLYFDPDNNGGNTPQTDDFRIMLEKYGNGTITYKESYGTGSGWGSEDPLENVTMAAKMDESRLYFEIGIAYDKLNISMDDYREVHMRVRSYINSTGYNVPYLANFYVPSEWTLLLTPASRWSIGYMTFDAHNGSAVNIDGVTAGGEWDDGFSTDHWLQINGKSMYVSMKTDSVNEKLNIWIYYPSPVDSNYTRIYVGFDVNNDHDGGVKEDDIMLGITFQDFAMEWNGTSHGSWYFTAPSGWSYAMDNSSASRWTIEISIDYSKLGLTPGVSKDMGIVISIVDHNVGVGFLPVGGNLYNTSRWNRLTSSDNWGNPEEIPEFNPVLAILLAVGLLAIIARRKK